MNTPMEETLLGTGDASQSDSLSTRTREYTVDELKPSSIQIRTDADKQEWARCMRLLFSPPEMVLTDGSINEECVLRLWWWWRW
jgi:hypothetical protein